MAGVPEDLAAWFAGRAILGDRHGMPRIQTRWRVVEVEALLGDTDDPYIVKGEWREFRTHKAARLYADRLARTATVLIQPGFTFWPDPDEMPPAE